MKSKQLPTKVCQTCGAVFTRNPRIAPRQWEAMRFCNKKCAGVARRVHKVPRPDPAVIRKLYEVERKNTREIATLFGTNKKMVGCWLREFGIKPRPPTNNIITRGVEPPTADDLRRMIYTEYLSYQAVADLYGVDMTTVPYWLDKHGIARPAAWNSRHKGVSLPDHDRLQSLRDQGLSLGSIAALCHLSDSKIRTLCHKYGIAVNPSGFNGGIRYPCLDGTQVRSRYEQQVADWLYVRSTPYVYEPTLPFNRRMHADFLVNGWYVEIWGVKESEGYECKKGRKLVAYRSYGLPLIQLLPYHFKERGAKTFLKLMSRCLTSALPLFPDGPDES